MDSTNQLYYGDNLDVLRRHIPDESVDLVYLDPPFKSEQNYNVLFAEHDGTRAAAQIQAFEDTWQWDQSAASAYEEAVEAGGKVAQVMLAFRTFLGDSDMLAYLAMMGPRLVELRRVLRPTGSLYLHCDPTASYYLKLLLDAVFGPENFRNEIIWKRTTAHSDTRGGFSRVSDTILYYGSSDKARWNPLYKRHKESYLKSHYGRADTAGRHYRLDNIIRSPSMGPRPNLVYEYKGSSPSCALRRRPGTRPRWISPTSASPGASASVSWSCSATPASSGCTSTGARRWPWCSRASERWLEGTANARVHGKVVMALRTATRNGG